MIYTTIYFLLLFQARKRELMTVFSILVIVVENVFVSFKIMYQTRSSPRGTEQFFPILASPHPHLLLSRLWKKVTLSLYHIGNPVTQTLNVWAKGQIWHNSRLYMSLLLSSVHCFHIFLLIIFSLDDSWLVKRKGETLWQ